MVYTSLVISILVAVLAIALGGAYFSGALDPLIQQLGVLFFKAKAEAEVKKLQAQGLQEGEDFVKGISLLIFLLPPSIKILCSICSNHKREGSVLRW